MNIQRATVSDAQEILALQIMAFKSQAELYNDYALPPLSQNITSICLFVGGFFKRHIDRYPLD